MSKEYIIILLSWIIVATLLLVFIPKNKIRHAWVIFLFTQFITWIFGLSVVELKWIEYPIRLFPHSSYTSFTFEFFIYPGLCILFNLHYPTLKTRLHQFLHYFYYCSAITIIEVILEKNTQLIKYTGWAWYFTWISLYVTFYLSRRIYLWFFRLNS